MNELGFLVVLDVDGTMTNIDDQRQRRVVVRWTKE